MTIEQTDQLLQLTLNALLLLLSCVGWAGLCHLRRWTRGQRLAQLRHLYWMSDQSENGGHPDRRIQLRPILRQVKRGYRCDREGERLAQAALGLASLSTLAIAMRTLWGWNGLISISLVSFVGSVAMLLVSIGWLLWEWHLPVSGEGLAAVALPSYWLIPLSTAITPVPQDRLTGDRNGTEPAKPPQSVARYSMIQGD